MPADRDTLSVLENYYPAYMRWHAVLPGAELYDEPELVWAYTGLPVLGRVLRTRLTEANADETIAGVIQRFSSFGAPITWQVEPSATPADLGGRLRAAGLARKPDRIGMARQLENIPAVDAPNGFSIERVRAAGDLDRWLDAFCAAYTESGEEERAFRRLFRASFEADPETVKLFTGVVHERPAATGALFVHENAAAITWIGTDPAYSGQGLGTAVTAHLLAEGKRAGCRNAILQSTQEGSKMYERLGFVASCRFKKYGWTPHGRTPSAGE